MDQAAIIPRATPTVHRDRRITSSFCRCLPLANKTEAFYTGKLAGAKDDLRFA